jgi:pimeloyl-ACP methyl ester carboxylesterase
MHRNLRLIAALLCIAWGLAPALLHASRRAKESRIPPQETGFLNRRIQINGATYRYQVYLPEEWRRDDHKQWPVILFLHGRGERGSEGMWQTQIGLPQQLRDHPERWPFVVVMPQCPQGHYWTDRDMLSLSMTELDQEAAEFHGDSTRTYLAGLSLGGYGAWELARLHPTRWAAVTIAAGGIFWSYEPERWQRSSTLPAEYAQAVGHTPIWLFHGSEDNIVVPRQSDLMYSAVKSAGGHIRLWIYQSLRHDCWTRAFNEPELPRWLLANRRDPHHEPQAFAERLSVPLHPPAIKLTPAQLDSLAGEYQDSHGLLVLTLFRQADQLYQKNLHGEVAELAADTPTTLFYPTGNSFARITVERDTQNRVTSLLLRDDRHEERWERMRPGLRTHAQPE